LAEHCDKEKTRRLFAGGFCKRSANTIVCQLQRVFGGSPKIARQHQRVLGDS